MRASRAGSAIVLCTWTRVARADGVARPEDLWSQWGWEPVLLGLLAGWGMLYLRGLGRLRRRSGGRAAARWRARCCFAGAIVLTLAIMSPLDALGGTLFSAHMAQHLALVALAAPLLALGRPWDVTLWGLDLPVRKRVLGLLRRQPLRAARGTLSQPLVVLFVHTAALWVWHLPAWYEAALSSAVLHWLEHVAFFGTAFLYWTVVSYGGPGRGVVIVYLFAGATQGALLGALITVAPVAWYPAHAAGARAWGLTPLEDQQLAGLLMWVPGAAVYLAFVLAVGAAWLEQSEVAVRRGERRRARRLESSSHG